MKFALGFVVGYTLHSAMITLIARDKNAWADFKRKIETAYGYNTDISMTTNATTDSVESLMQTAFLNSRRG